MTSTNFSYTPLYGMGQDEPLCSILQIGSYTVLLDCGWDCKFDESMLLPLKEIAQSVDIILLSSSAIEVSLLYEGRHLFAEYTVSKIQLKYASLCFCCFYCF